MKFLVISDTHGKIEKVSEIFPLLQGIDMIIHLGDYDKDGDRLAQELGVDVLAVKGNMDGSYSREDCKILETEYGKILLTHGHIEGVSYSLQNLYYHAQEAGCIAAFYGHTHKAAYEQVGDIYMLNPGSLSLPRDGSGGSYAIVTTSPEEFTASVVYYQKIESTLKSQSQANAKAKPKVQGGYLRDMLNNSDRF